jgi:predicted TIM-barrel fold metal-dependent hydrolase
MDFTAKADLLMFGSSYPHWSMSSPEVMAAGLDRAQREKVLWRNASDLYGLTVPATESSVS